VRATVRLVKASYCWPKMSRDITEAAHTCMGCQLGKIHRQVSLQPEHIAIPHRRFSHLHIDLVGPLPKSSGYTHLFTIIDRTPGQKQFPCLLPPPPTAQPPYSPVQCFGLPAAITSDRGPQFTSALWAALCKLLDITHISTTSYHPQSNGLVERFHRRLEDALRARSAGQDWVSHLPWVMLGIRSAWREGTTFSPAESVYGAPKRTHHRRPSSQTYKESSLGEQSCLPNIIPHQHHSSYQRNFYLPNTSWYTLAATTLTNTGDPPAPVAAPPPRRHCRCRVTFSCPVVTKPTSP